MTGHLAEYFFFGLAVPDCDLPGNNRADNFPVTAYLSNLGVLVFKHAYIFFTRHQAALEPAVISIEFINS